LTNDQAVALGRVELLDGDHQADVALLHQVQQLEAVAPVFMGGFHHEAQVGHHQPVGQGLGARGLVLAGKLHLLLPAQEGVAVDVGDITVEGAVAGCKSGHDVGLSPCVLQPEHEARGFCHLQSKERANGGRQSNNGAEPAV
jgi:hypothetical protein